MAIPIPAEVHGNPVRYVAHVDPPRFPRGYPEDGDLEEAVMNSRSASSMWIYSPCNARPKEIRHQSAANHTIPIFIFPSSEIMLWFTEASSVGICENLCSSVPNQITASRS